MDKFLTFPGLLLPLLGLALLASCGADARVAKETPLLTRALPDVPGREVLIETVVLAPGKVMASPVMWKKRNGAFFRLVKSTTSRPPWQAATGGTRHGEEYQQVGRSA